MIKEEFQELVTFFDRAANGELSNLQELYDRLIKFFDQVTECVKNGTEEDKAQVKKMLTALGDRIQMDSDRVCKNMEMNAETLLEFSDNPSNYSPDEWREIQKNREQISKKGKALMSLLS